MKRLSLILLSVLLFSCEEKENVLPIKIKKDYLVVGNHDDCYYVKYKNDGLVLNSSYEMLDIDTNDIWDINFSINDVFIDDCDEVFENCPEDQVCDCFATIYSDYNLTLNTGIEIAIDSRLIPMKFQNGDTISNRNLWTSHLNHAFYHREPHDDDLEQIIGLRKTTSTDTLYAWIKLEINNIGIVIDEHAIQNPMPPSP